MRNVFLDIKKKVNLILNRSKKEYQQPTSADKLFLLRGIKKNHQPRMFYFYKAYWREDRVTRRQMPSKHP